MAMSVRYTNFGGRIVAEDRGGVKRGYVHDPQGNVIALVDDTGAITDEFEYWPFGELKSHTGSSETPFTWNGAHGYYTDPTLTYVRARYYSTANAQWQTKDPLWPDQQAYGYAAQNPITNTDPSGNQYQDPMREWGNKYFPPGAGVPNWIIPDDKQKCISDWWEGERFLHSLSMGFGGPFPAWEYGNCCGYNKKCGPSSKTYTCADEACKQHDMCLATFKDVFTKYRSCNEKYCNDMKYCWNNLCAGKVVYDRRQCQALYEMSHFFCTSIGLSGAPGGFPPPKW